MKDYFNEKTGNGESCKIVGLKEKNLIIIKKSKLLCLRLNFSAFKILWKKNKKI